MNFGCIKVQQVVNIPSEQDHNQLNHFFDSPTFGLDGTVNLWQQRPFNKVTGNELRTLFDNVIENLKPLNVLMML